MNIHKSVELASTKLTGKRFCSNCNQTQQIIGGNWKTSNNVRRWKCRNCVAGAKANEKKL